MNANNSPRVGGGGQGSRVRARDTHLSFLGGRLMEASSSASPPPFSEQTTNK